MKSDRISQCLQEQIDANDFPSAVYLVAEKGAIVLQDASVTRSSNLNGSKRGWIPSTISRA